MKKFLRKLLPTIVMLAVSATLVGTSTFAWFSMNNKVTVTGMVVKTKVSSNLLIANDKDNATHQLDDSEFTNEILQSVTGLLEPVSTADAVNFFYTIDAKADGSYSKTGSEAFYKYVDGQAASDAKYADKFSEVYGITTSDATLPAGQTKAVPYVDYIFQLKASNTVSEAQNIIVEKLELKYRGGEPKGTAHRVAFFIHEIADKNSVPSSASAITSSSTYRVQSSANFDRTGKTGSGATSEAVVNGANSYADAKYVESATKLAVVPGNQTKYYKIIVRMWLEGQDTSCNNETYMSLTNEWELGIKLALVAKDDNGTVTSINQINSSATFFAD